MSDFSLSVGLISKAWKATFILATLISFPAFAGWEERPAIGWAYGNIYCNPYQGKTVLGPFNSTNFAPDSKLYHVEDCWIANQNAHPSYVRYHACVIVMEDEAGVERVRCTGAASAVCPTGFDVVGPLEPQLGMCYRSAGNGCPPGMAADAKQICRPTTCVAPMVQTPQGNCVPPPQNKKRCPIGAESCPKPDQLPSDVANPISFTSGAKVETEVDYKVFAANSALTFIRYYDSQSPSHSGRTGILPLGNKWSHNFAKRLELLEDGRVAAMRGDGRVIYMNRAPGTTYQQWFGDDDINESITRYNGYWYYQAADGSVEGYYQLWQLNEITYPDGRFLQLGYDNAGHLTYVTDKFSRRLTFEYVGDRIASVTLPSKAKIQYEYTGDELTGVVYPDGTRKTYTYTSLNIGGVAEPSMLTDIIDENGNNYAHWGYDSVTGFAISSEHAGGVDRYQLTYANDANGLPQSVAVMNPLGAQSSFGIRRVWGVAQPVSEFNSALGATRSQTFDSRGNLSSTTDYKGNVTTYTYDMARNLEVKRVQASNSANALTTTTEWHSYWRLPLRVAEPGKLTTYVYNGDTYAGSLVSCTVTGYNRITKLPQGTQMPGPVVCKRIEQGTTDSNGSLGLNATFQGAPRVFSYTYGTSGLATVDGPRTDVNDVTSLGYFSYGAAPKAGTVSTVTNPLGQVTTFVDYNADGQPLQVTDANGVTTTLTYDWRGRLKTKTIGNEVTSYQYDGVGQLVKLTLPDGSYLTYTYDAARRLTDVADSLGNSIHYTLDAMGNRVKEEVKDPLGTLSQQTTRVYDALKRLQTLTGAQQ